MEYIVKWLGSTNGSETYRVCFGVTQNTTAYQEAQIGIAGELVFFRFVDSEYHIVR